MSEERIEVNGMGRLVLRPGGGYPAEVALVREDQPNPPRETRRDTPRTDDVVLVRVAQDATGLLSLVVPMWQQSSHLETGQVAVRLDRLAYGSSVLYTPRLQCEPDPSWTNRLPRGLVPRRGPVRLEGVEFSLNCPSSRVVTPYSVPGLQVLGRVRGADQPEVVLTLVPEPEQGRWRLRWGDGAYTLGLRPRPATGGPGDVEE